MIANSKEESEQQVQSLTTQISSIFQKCRWNPRLVRGWSAIAPRLWNPPGQALAHAMSLNTVICSDILTILHKIVSHNYDRTPSCDWRRWNRGWSAAVAAPNTSFLISALFVCVFFRFYVCSLVFSIFADIKTSSMSMNIDECRPWCKRGTAVVGTIIVICRV